MTDIIYKAIWDEDALYDLKKLDRKIAEDIKKKIENYLVKSPRKLGKPLSGPLGGLYRYKYPRDYRIIYEIIQTEKIIIITAVGHRSQIYK